MYNYIPRKTEEIITLSQNPVDEDLIATVIAGVIEIARSRGQSLEDLNTELLQNDDILSSSQRSQLSMVITQAWNTLE